MALVKYGGGIVGASGSIAGNTHARNRFGNYIRARTKPVNPNTALQQVIRNALTQLTAHWGQTLEIAERTAWNLYASSVAMKNRLGEVIYLTGFNHFLRSNIVRVQSGLTIIEAGPTIFELPAKDPKLVVTAVGTTGKITVTYDKDMAWSLETGSYLIIFQGRPQNPQRNFFGGPWRLMGKIAGVTTEGATGSDEFDKVYGITATQRLWIYARIVRLDGRLSQPFYASCVVA